MNRILKFLQPQPTPRETLFAASSEATAITRFWEPGDAEHCRLCPKRQCSYSPETGACLILVPEFIPEDRIQMFNARDRSWQAV